MTTQTQITTFDRSACREVGTRIDEALAALAADLGIQITRKGGTFTAGNFTLKIECAVKSADGTVETREAVDFKRLAHLYGLKPEHLGMTFRRMGKTYTVIGIKTRARKYPILCRTSDGKTYKMPEQTVALHLNAETQNGGK